MISDFKVDKDVIDFSIAKAPLEFADLTIAAGVDGAEISTVDGVIAVLTGVDATTVDEDDFIF